MIKQTLQSAILLSSASLLLASCSAEANGDIPATPGVDTADPFTIERLGEFEEPWAAAFAPGTETLVITEKEGTIKAYMPNGRTLDVSGAPEVDYGGQGGMGDVAFLESEASSTLGSRTIYLSWVEAGSGGKRGAAVGKGQFTCAAQSCSINDLNVIWRQDKVSGKGHYSHRLAFSPDGEYLYVASGDRQKKQPAQDLTNNLGTVVRLTLDGKPAEGNPFADQGSPTDQIWSYGHRNILGLQFDAEGRLWDLEHGPAGGDELNLVERGANYGWPVVSDGDEYSGRDIPDHSTRPEFSTAAIGWTPVIAPGNYIFYSGDMFDAWKGDALIAGLSSEAIVRVTIDGETATETGRYTMKRRIREIVQAPDGSLLVLEDGGDAGLLKLTPRQ
ncbi:PQQ-dependent sugar dehydrogenase [Altererythrobacter sp. ZODW24]|uniref:PQQ-dependent sugar dehydrogenase n=1 Tax=Altererythrobacter sp. ZODW24 TaxID=2185142 RepID=UPI000DF7DAA2|nr:PQQ-dependent sugar dehydrogenase [Altererythrobacter sp. ZODW24]